MADDDLFRLAADLDKAAGNVGKFSRKAIEVTARKVKDGWRDKLKGATALPSAAASITYDIKGGEAMRGDAIEAEIGPELGRRQGNIVGLVELGTGSNVSARGYGLAALRDQAEDFLRGQEFAAEDALREAGLG